MKQHQNGHEPKRPISSSAVVRIVIWSLVLCILCGVFAVSMLAQAVADTGRGIGGIFSFGNYHYGEESTYTVGGGEITETVCDLNISWLNGNVEILPAEKGASGITISEDYDGTDKDICLRYRVRGGKLDIKFQKSLSVFGIQRQTPEKKLTVRIPQEMLDDLDEVSIDTVDSHVVFKGNAEEFSYDAVCGSLDAEGHIGELEIDGVDAEVYFTGTLGKGNFDGVRVRSTLRLDAAQKLDADGVDTRVTLYLGERVTGFSVEHDSLGGDLTIQGFDDVISHGKKGKTWGDGSLKIDADGVDAELIIGKTTESTE